MIVAAKRRWSRSGRLAWWISSWVCALGAACTPVSGTAVPVDGAPNQADLTLTAVSSRSSTSYLQPPSTIDFSFTPATSLLELTDLDLRGSDLHFDFGSLLVVDVLDVRVRRSPDGAAILGSVNPESGVVSVLAPVEVDGAVYLNNSLVFLAAQPVVTALTGTFTYDPSSGEAQLSDFVGDVPPTTIPVGPFTLVVTGTLTFNFAATIPPPSG